MRECAEACVKHNVTCPVKDCRLWIEYDQDLNCTDIAVAKHGKMTLREISERLGVSFVRIKQIEDGLKVKLKKRINNLNRINNCR